MPGRRTLPVDLLRPSAISAPAGLNKGWNPYRQVEQLLPERQLAGFALLVDACWASTARPEINQWGVDPHNFVWMGASQHAEAYDGCFSTTLAELMRSGDISTHGGARPAPNLHAHHALPLINDRCADQDADGLTSHSRDDYILITQNRAVDNYEDETASARPAG